MSFDIDAYRRSVTPVRVDDLDWSAFERDPLPPDVLRCLRYMHDVESHTVCYLRDLLMTASHRDPRITTFLTMWNYEEHWHGVAIGRVLRAHGEPAADDRVAALRARQGAKAQLAPLVHWLASALVGDDFVATHMTWGAVNEWSTQTGYARLAEVADHPVLTQLLERIARQESRHIAFYATEARDRLARSAKARRATRWTLQKLWSPVGSTVMPQAETRFLLGHLMGGADGIVAARRIDDHVDGLPGLAGLHLVATALEQWGVVAADGSRRLPAPAEIAA